LTGFYETLFKKASRIVEEPGEDSAASFDLMHSVYRETSQLHTTSRQSNFSSFSRKHAYST
jgi:hypothetical protein